MIPIYNRIKVQNKEKNVFLLGDAALLVKATSGGGVINSMLSARVLCSSIKDNTDYDKGLERLRKNLWLHSLIRQRLNKMSDNKTEKLLDMLNQDRAKKVLLERGDMDFPRRFMLSLVARNPGLLRFVF